jgi:hypothetical protein
MREPASVVVAHSVPLPARVVPLRRSAGVDPDTKQKARRVAGPHDRKSQRFARDKTQEEFRDLQSEATSEALKSKYAGELAYQIAEVHAFRGEADLAFEWLEYANAQRDRGVVDIKRDRLMRGLADDPRYKRRF